MYYVFIEKRNLFCYNRKIIGGDYIILKNTYKYLKKNMGQIKRKNEIEKEYFNLRKQYFEALDKLDVLEQENSNLMSEINWRDEKIEKQEDIIDDLIIRGQENEKLITKYHLYLGDEILQLFKSENKIRKPELRRLKNKLNDKNDDGGIGI